MSNSESGGAQVALTALTAIIGTGALLALPDLIPSPFNFFGWAIVIACLILSFVFFQKEKKQKEIAKKELEQSRLRKSRNSRKEKEKQEKQLELTREKLIKKEEKATEKYNEKKRELEKEAKATWNGRMENAKNKEAYFKSVIEKSNKMPVRNAAGKAAFEWHEASSVAQWVLQQVSMFMQRPDVTNLAREEAREAIIDSLRVKQSGSNWSAEQGQALAHKKEKAAEEEKIEENRIKEIKNEMENANSKWRAAELRANRWQDELEKMIKL